MSDFCWFLRAYLNVSTRESSNIGRRTFPHSSNLFDTKDRFLTSICGYSHFTSQCCLQVFREFSSYYLQFFSAFLRNSLQVVGASLHTFFHVIRDFSRNYLQEAWAFSHVFDQLSQMDIHVYLKRLLAEDPVLDSGF
jgi:hypothetical protein